MGSAKRQITPTERLSLREIFEHVRRREGGLLAPQERVQALILNAWREGKLPLAAAEVREAWWACPMRLPTIWVERPVPGDVVYEQYIDSELRKSWTVKFLPASDALDASVPIEQDTLHDQSIPTSNIPFEEFDFNWATSTALWRDTATDAVVHFIGIGASRVAVDAAWPSAAALVTGARWAADEIKLMKDRGEIATGIRLGVLARLLKPRMDAAFENGLVEHTAKNEKALQVSLSRWDLWPI